jgi:hypothetical protein
VLNRGRTGWAVPRHKTSPEQSEPAKNTLRKQAASPRPGSILEQQRSDTFPRHRHRVSLKPSELSSRADVFAGVVTFVVWLVLLVLCWPLALLALILYPIVWIALIPFRLVGIALDGVLELLRSIVMLPARLLRRPSIR